MLQYLPWDSHCFGYKVGEIRPMHNDFEQVIQQARQEGFRLLYLKANPEDKLINTLAQSYGGVLVDEKVTFTRTLPDHIPDSKAVLYQSNELHPELLHLAIQSGAFSRFRVDKNFRNNEYEKLYTAWISNSIRKEIAKEIIIYEKNNQIVGLLTIALQADKVGLVAVEPAYQRQGIGRELFWKAFALAKCWNVSHLQLVVQKANTKACLFYQNIGFEIQKTENTYHFWL